LAAVTAARNAALDAEIAAELLTTSGLCAVLDAYGVQVPGPVAAHVCWYSTPTPARATERAAVPQDLHATNQPALRSLAH
jgi:hypothetical protein